MSTRVKVTREPGQIVGWFNPDSAKQFDESTWHDGSNFISKATGSQWEHETLFYTASGNWILNCWSQYQGQNESYEYVDSDFAAEWFVKNEYSDSELEGLPEKVRNKVVELINQAEL